MRVALFLLLDFAIVLVITALIVFSVAFVRYLDNKRHKPVIPNLQDFKNGDLYREAELDHQKNAHIDEKYAPESKEQVDQNNLFYGI